jgi:NAD(P)-dependent dehydrogenase (short-subunit alcohol dehydrogenase family)
MNRLIRPHNGAPGLGTDGRRQGNRDECVQGDVSRLADLDSLFAQIKQEKQKLDILFANAGVAKYAPLATRGDHRGAL